MSQRAPGADVPDFLVAGARDILVPESGAEAAREALIWERPARRGLLDRGRLAGVGTGAALRA